MQRAFLLALGLLVLPAEAAKQSSIPNRFGAIAYHRESQSWGVSFDKARARDAAVEALRQCGHQRCEVVYLFKDGCATPLDAAEYAIVASGVSRYHQC